MRRRLPAILRVGLPYLAAVAAWGGALVPVPLPMVAGVGALVTGVATRRTAPILLAVGFAASVFAANAVSGLASPTAGPWTGEVVLVGDPSARGGGTAVDVSTPLGRLELVAWGGTARMLTERQAGDRLRAVGRIGPFPDPGRVAHRHLRGRLTATSLSPHGPPVRWLAPATVLRRLVLAGTEGLPPAQRPIYAGFVLGDDRGRSEQVTAEFESSGLSHLLVVSGENVVFVLLVLSPILDRLGRRTRVIVAISALVVFAAATRFEPSVLRATVMAGVATLAVASGRATSGRRALAIAVVVLVLIDPLLVRSVGFRLSVAAAAGIVVLGPTIERGLRGPRRLRAVLAVTIAAQVAVAPLIVPLFGPMPLVAIPANVLAEPVAGLVMMWGCTGGIVAGLIGGSFGELLQLPARLGLGWVMGVAHVASRFPRLEVGLAPLVGGVALVVCVAVVRGRVRRGPRAPVPAAAEG